MSWTPHSGKKLYVLFKDFTSFLSSPVLASPERICDGILIAVLLRLQSTCSPYRSFTGLMPLSLNIPSKSHPQGCCDLFFWKCCVIQLQPCFTDTAGMTRVQQSRMGKQMISPCLANLPAAVVGGLSRWIPSPSSLDDVKALGRPNQRRTKVCALTFTLMETKVRRA